MLKVTKYKSGDIDRYVLLDRLLYLPIDTRLFKHAIVKIVTSAQKMGHQISKHDHLGQWCLSG